MRHYLGIDIGTTSMKAAVFDENGTRLGVKSVDYTLSTDPATGYIEFEAERYVEMCEEVIAALTAECGGIDALSVDTQGETLILTDAAGKPLAPAVVWLDNRAVREAEEITRAFGRKRVYEVTGQPEITAGWPASKLLWFRRNRPEVFAAVKKIFLLEDWILYRLTGEFVTEPTIQSSTIYYDITKRVWWREMLDFIGIDETMLPRLEKSAREIGTYKGIRVVTGGLDQIAGTIGAGVTDGTRASEMTGTIMAICLPVEKIPPFREDSIIPCHMHAIDGKYCLILWSSTAGMALKWFRNNLGEQFSFKELDELAAAVPAGCEGLSMLPYFCGSTMPRYNPEARAVFAGVELGHTRAHFTRAILEAVAFLLRENLEYVGTDGIRELRITGGGALSPLWAQIKADVTGKELSTVAESETACLGTAILAAVGVGDFPTVKEAAERIVRTGKHYLPGGTDYTAAYERYQNLDCLMNRGGKE